MGKVKLIGKLDYVQGYLRYGHFEVEVDELFVKETSQQKLKEYLQNHGELVIDDFSIEDRGEIMELEVQKGE